MKTKRLLSIILVLCMVLGTLPLAGIPAWADAGVGFPVFTLTSGDYEYVILDGAKKTCEITDYTGAGGNITIPSKLDGYSVTSIDVSAFADCTSLASVVIPDSVKSIGWYAFEDCTSLASVVIPDSVTSIGDHAFEGCTSLASVTIGNSVTSIGAEAFLGCTSLETITVNEGNAEYSSAEGVLFNKDKTKIVIYPGGKKNTEYIIPDSVTSIGTYAFYRCTSLASVVIPDSVTSIGYGAFYGCTSLESVVIPDSVTSISDRAFYGCTSLESVVIPDSVTSIGDWAFDGCTSLESVVIPDSVKSIGAYAFNDTAYYKDESNWKNNVLYIGNHLIEARGTISGNYNIKAGTKTVAGYAFGYCTSLASVVIPDSVTSIGGSAFEDCTSLESVVIPDSVTSIGGGAFRYCTSLASVVIPDSVTSIGGYAFEGCTSLASVVIPDSVTYIGYEAFLYCTSLASVVIPDSVTSIGYDAFEGCTSLASVVIPDSVTSIGWSAFRYCTSLETITVNEGNAEYSSAEGVLFNKDKTEIVIYPGGKKNTEYIIPDSVTSIGDDAFRDCTSLKSIVIPDSVTSIGDHAFEGCTSLASVTIGNSVTSIGGYAFRDCTSLASVVIPDSVTSIGDWAFYGCTSLASVVIPDSVTSIGGYAFDGCTSLESVVIPDSVTSIGNDAFRDTAYYKDESNWKNNVLYIGNHLIEVEARDTISGNYNIKAGTKTIAEYAFSGCTSLESVVIPDSVTSIGEWAFYGCESLKNVYYNGTEAQWEKISVNEGNEALTSAIIHFKGEVHEHSYTATVTKESTCTEEGLMTYTCKCGDSYTEPIPKKPHSLRHIVVKSTCTVAGMEYDLCDECGQTFNSEVLPLKEHTWTEWKVTKEPTGDTEGEAVRTCTVCGKTEMKVLPKLQVIQDEKTGVKVEYSDQYDSGVELEVTEIFDGKSFQIIETDFGNVNSKIFDISTVKDGVKVQPSGKVKVRVPLPESFRGKKVFVCYVDSENGKAVSVPAKVVDSFVEFEAEHFSQYAVIEEKGSVHSVSVGDIKLNYKKSMKLSPSIAVDEGVKYKVEYSSSDNKVATVDKNGKVYGAHKGDAVITCTVTDEYGNVVKDTANVKINYNFSQWLIVILLFGWIWY